MLKSNKLVFGSVLMSFDQQSAFNDTSRTTLDIFQTSRERSVDVPLLRVFKKNHTDFWLAG